MSIQKAIEKAVEGGWDYKGSVDIKWQENHQMFITTNERHPIFQDVIKLKESGKNSGQVASIIGLNIKQVNSIYSIA